MNLSLQPLSIAAQPSDSQRRVWLLATANLETPPHKYASDTPLPIGADPVA